MIIVLYVFGIAYIPNSHFIVQRRSCRVFGAPIFVAGNFYAGEIVCECGQIRPWKRLQIVVFRIVIALCDSKKIVGMLRPLLFRDELREFDESYRTNSGSEILKKVSDELQIKEEEIYHLVPAKDENGLVTGVKFEIQGKQFEYDYQLKKLIHGGKINE